MAIQAIQVSFKPSFLSPSSKLSYDFMLHISRGRRVKSEAQRYGKHKRRCSWGRTAIKYLYYCLRNWGNNE